MTDTTAPLRLFNSLTRQVEEFHPVHQGEARVYTCGPTVYNYPHIGNMRAYVFADTLGRVLSFKGYRLTHVINITDVGHLTDDADAGEDKMEKMAAAKAQSIWDIAKHYTEAYLGRCEGAQYPPACALVDRHRLCAADDRVREEHRGGKHCYELDSGLYFDTSTVADYGRLARARPRKARAGSRRSRASATRRTSRSGARPRRARSARWNGTRPGAGARRAGTLNVR
jgi:cysteinyl-tRNA synthetase